MLVVLVLWVNCDRLLCACDVEYWLIVLLGSFLFIFDWFLFWLLVTYLVWNCI